MEIKVALVGNPNVGKTSVFNTLTGLNQKVGNYPGITVDRKTGHAKINDQLKATIIDLPGLYSIQPNSKDEEVVLETLFDEKNSYYPNVVVVVAEVENLKRNLLLLTQIKDLGFPTILAINMADQMAPKGISIDLSKLSSYFKCSTVLISSKSGLGFNDLKSAIASYEYADTKPVFELTDVDESYFRGKEYKAWLNRSQNAQFNSIHKIEDTLSVSDIKRLQQKETVRRYQLIQGVLKEAYQKDINKATGWQAKVDRILMHPVWGYVIFFAIMLVVFQSIFSWSSIPTDWIDEKFAQLSAWISATLPEGKFTELLAEGIVPGIGGVVIFIPQIAILFMFIALLEESGYMSRVVFLMDKLMRPFGLSGKSVVPLISGVACAIPAIMSARNIENPKERLITMLVTPFATCSARIPIYVIIISLVIPNTTIGGFMGLQGLVMTLMYFLGFLAALGGAWLLKKMVRSEVKSYLIIEMPTYRRPQVFNVVNTMIEKTKAFVEGAGKIILALSVLLWFLGAHGPASTFGQAEELITQENKTPEEWEDEVQGFKLRNSYIGMIGSAVEPVFRPLGYDWKVSIAVLTSFAAREVFVGNLATLYNIGSQGEEETRIVERMRQEKRPDGSAMFDLATGVSLLLFYAFAMQCMSTLGVMRRETNSWKWTLIQIVFMSGLAYLSAFAAFQLLK
ncbi:ferrous iron transport protein B [Leadbetterella byssophila DSM 17132]|uniref:Ferrous iron transport protein B n=1 Tax=Leadbetterella byssophila (strain DSM 17132 / JCM 16389 / KACC 11308 / NBRC 106382 / 4M15) TaxID=649349 RepID=E4RUV5_LEAB4|nr:ferrous iron transport protein B [Leadbetterella byssophila]ADQ16978.1 ferrous iron transport protein B [Leadbetterella byssophila DSM 17132]